MAEQTEVEGNGSPDESEQYNEETPLLFEVSGAGLKDDIADFEHGLVCFQAAHFKELPNAKEESEHNDSETPVENLGVGMVRKTAGHF